MFDVESRRIPGNRAFRGNRRKNRTDVRFDARVVGIFGISGERQQSYGRQYRENRDYDDEFDECESSDTPLLTPFLLFFQHTCDGRLVTQTGYLCFHKFQRFFYKIAFNFKKNRVRFRSVSAHRVK